MNLVLVGLMGSGKSTVGRLLAQRLGRSFLDTDTAIQETAGRSIPEIFAIEGEAGFRAREADAVATAARQSDGVVIATGGGAVMAAANRDALRESGFVVWLDAEPAELLRRATGDGLTQRPLLAGHDPLGRLSALAAQRQDAYAAAAHLRVETGGRTPDQVVDAVLAAFEAAVQPAIVPVELGDRSYQIRIEPGGLRNLGSQVAAALPRARRALIITDETVARLYGEAALASLQAAGLTAALVAIPAGEASKSLEQVAQVYPACVAAGLERSSAIVALGGGVVGDLAGFVAAPYLRGLPFVQVPTTLLAQVDSSVGGKTGVDLPAGKNLVGAFHQPSFVLADVTTLRSLPHREVAAGMAEVIKHAVIRDAAFFPLLEAGVERIQAQDPAYMTELIARNCGIKAAVVSADEREGGLRAILNFGHTVGHAVEALLGFAWLHGECVAVGMVAAARLSAAVGVLQEPELVPRLERLLARLGLPTRLPEAVTMADLAPLMQRDKKVAGGRVHWVLPVRLGEVTVTPEVPGELVERVLASLKEGGAS